MELNSLLYEFGQSKNPIYKEQDPENDNSFVEISSDVLKPIPKFGDKDHAKAQKKLG